MLMSMCTTLHDVPPAVLDRCDCVQGGIVRCRQVAKASDIFPFVAFPYLMGMMFPADWNPDVAVLKSLRSKVFSPFKSLQTGVGLGFFLIMPAPSTLTPGAVSLAGSGAGS